MKIDETKNFQPISGSEEQSSVRAIDIDKIEKILKFAAKFVPAFWVMLVFGYCSSINFYPSGLTVGDTLFFAFSTIGFGMIYGFIVGSSVYCAANLYGLIARVFSCRSWAAFCDAVCTRLYRVVGKKIGTVFSLAIPSVVSGVFLLILCLVMSELDYVWGLISFFGLLAIGFSIWVVIGMRREAFKDNPWTAFLAVTVLTVMPLLMVHGLANTVTNTAMRLAGVRIERALVDMPQSEYVRVQATANRAAVKVPPCRKLTTDRCLLRADVLFQGVGQRVQIRLPVGGAQKDKNGDTLEPEAFVTLQQSDIKISTINPFTYGADINSDATFDFDSSILTENGRSKLDAIAKEVAEYRILSLEVTGHTDRLGSDEHNLELSLQRAQAVADYLARRLGDVPPTAIHTYGVGASTPRLEQKRCPGRAASDALRRCLADDRYVEVDIVAAKRSRKRASD